MHVVWPLAAGVLVGGALRVGPPLGIGSVAMKPATIDRFIRFAWPEGVVTLVALVLLALPRTRVVAAPFLVVFPYVVLAVGVVLGLRFSRGRLLAALLSLAAIHVAVDRLGPRGSIIAL